MTTPSIKLTHSPSGPAPVELDPQQAKALSHRGTPLFIAGGPGTGKTTVAKLYARLLCATGMLSKDEVVEKTASDFISEAVGGSSQRTKEILKLAEGKALFIDEAYNLFDGSSQTSGGKVSYGSEVSRTMQF